MEAIAVVASDAVSSCYRQVFVVFARIDYLTRITIIAERCYVAAGIARCRGMTLASERV